MKLTLRNDQSEIHSMLSGMLFAANLPYFKDQLANRWGLNIDVRIEKDLEELSLKLLSNKEITNFLDIDSDTKNIFLNHELMLQSKDIYEYFNNLLTVDMENIRDMIYKCIGFDKELEGTFEKDAIISLLKQLYNLEKTDEQKWFVLCLFQEPKKYLQRFIRITEDFLPLYNKIRDKYKKEFKSFTNWMDENLERQGLEFINKYLDIHNLNQYNRVYLTYSLFDLSYTYINNDKDTCHICLGLLFQNFVQTKLEKQDADKHITVFKIFSDKTRFEIIRMLAKEESFGQEIAQRLGITTATVSYHLDYLLGSSLVSINRRSRKIYYSLNKDRIQKSLYFLKDELDL